MSEAAAGELAVEVRHVYKKFKRGEIHDSLRDLLPALTGRWLRDGNELSLEEREFWALHDVSFEVARGEAFAIIGANGAGKSTILKHLSGIMKPTQGTVRVHGKLSALIEVGAGFHPDLTGRENIFLNASILGMKREEVRKRFDEIVEFSGLRDFIDTPVKRYSSGMYARLGFSVAAHVDSAILLVDEVLSVGDWAFQRKCQERMNAIIQGGGSVIFVSHNLRAIADMCSRALLLERGRVVLVGRTADALKEYIERSTRQDGAEQGKEVYVSAVTVRGADGPSVQFRSGQRVWVDVELTAAKRCDRLSVDLTLSDRNYYSVFRTNSERLGLDSFVLEPGGTRTVTFELALHLANGRFYVGAEVGRQDVGRKYDVRFPAATIFINSEPTVHGAVNLYPALGSPSLKGSGS